MADLNDDPTFAGFTRAISTTGSLELAWPPTHQGELHAWLLLLDPERISPSDLHPERLLAELIRIPLSPASGQSTVYVPVGRPLGLMLVARDEAGHPLVPPALTVADGRPVTRTAPSPARAPAPARIDPRAYGRIPLVFAEHRRPPDFDALAKRVADRTAPPPALRPFATPAGPSKKPMETPEPSIFSMTRPQTGFGLRQRWTLTRLHVPPSDTDRLVIARTTFIADADIRAWATAPPPDAIPMPPRCDGIVDGLHPEDTMVFYLVLERSPDLFHPVTPTPVAPPFEASRSPLLLGDPRARLEAITPRPGEAFAALLEAALTSLVNGVPSAAGSRA